MGRRTKEEGERKVGDDDGEDWSAETKKGNFWANSNADVVDREDEEKEEIGKFSARSSTSSCCW